MPLLTELRAPMGNTIYKDVAPTVLVLFRLDHFYKAAGSLPYLIELLGLRWPAC